MAIESLPPDPVSTTTQKPGGIKQHATAIVTTVVGSVVAACFVGLFTWILGQNATIGRLEERIKGLEARTDRLVTNEVSSTAIENSITSADQEIISLRNRVNALDATAAQYQTAINFDHDELGKVNTRLSCVAEIRERLATLEATVKYLRPSETAPQTPSGVAAANLPRHTP